MSLKDELQKEYSKLASTIKRTSREYANKHTLEAKKLYDEALEKAEELENLYKKTESELMEVKDDVVQKLEAAKAKAAEVEDYLESRYFILLRIVRKFLRAVGIIK